MTVPVTKLFGDPPPGINLSASNEIVDDTVVAVLAFIATLAVIMRLMVKKRQRARLEGDDWFILMALIGEYGTAACTFTGNYFGAGRHVWATETPSLRKMSIALFVYPWIYVVATVGLKLSFCWTYMRIFSIGSFHRTIRCQSWFDRCLVACVVSSFLYALSVWLPMTAACRPLSFFWDQYVGETNGKCIDYLLMWIITGIFSAILDLVILMLPIPKIWTLQMTWTRKCGILGILALGTLVVIAAIIRIIYMARMMHATDITWALGPAQIWTALEPSLGIVSSCLIPTFRPMVHSIRKIFGLKNAKRTKGSTGNNNRTIGSMTVDSKAYRNLTRFGSVVEEEDELALVGLKGGNDSRVTTKSVHTPLSGIAEDGIHVDKSFTINESPRAEV